MTDWRVEAPLCDIGVAPTVSSSAFKLICTCGPSTGAGYLMWLLLWTQLPSADPRTGHRDDGH